MSLTSSILRDYSCGTTTKNEIKSSATSFESEYDYPIAFSLDGKDPVNSDAVEIDFFEVNPELFSCDFVTVH